MAAIRRRIRKNETEKNHGGGSRLLYVVAGVALLAAAFVVWPRGPKEPVCQGKALTQWISEAHALRLNIPQLNLNLGEFISFRLLVSIERLVTLLIIQSLSIENLLHTFFNP